MMTYGMVNRPRKLRIRIRSLECRMSMTTYGMVDATSGSKGRGR